jgi:NAD(P)-dependent dehydrogenase (short-subunit alcohol dehydrogenase family)
MGRLQGKIVLVTGAAGGIGRAICGLFAAEGAELAASDLAAPEDVEGAALALALDVTREADWAAAVSQVVARFGRLDVLVNNAGIALSKDLEATTLDEWRHVMAVNLDGTFLGTKAAVAAMKPNGGGAIVNLSSVAGIIGAPMLAAYCAAKGGIRTFTKSAALYCARQGTGIRVNSLHPGFVDTAMLDGIAEALGDTLATVKDKLARRQPMGRLAEPLEVARAALYLASDEAAYMTGAELVLDGGFTAQ